MQSSERRKRKNKKMSITNIDNLYSNLRMRSDSSDRYTISSKEKVDELSSKENARDQEIRTRQSSKNGKRKKEEKKKLV